MKSYEKFAKQLKKILPFITIGTPILIFLDFILTSIIDASMGFYSIGRAVIYIVFSVLFVFFSNIFIGLVEDITKIKKELKDINKNNQ